MLLTRLPIRFCVSPSDTCSQEPLSPASSCSNRHKGEDGYMLVAVMFVMFVMILWMAVAIPKLSKDLQRDRELETMQRGKQYIRAIKLYYKKVGGFPPTIKALENTNGVRYLRKKYADPTTGKADWRLIHYGQAKAQTLGLFGQPIPMTMGGGGIGPVGGNCGIPGLNGTPNTLSGGSSSSFGSSGSSSFGSSSSSSFGSSSSSSFGSNSSSFGSSGSSFGGSSSGVGGTDCGTNSGSGSPTDPNAPQGQVAQDPNAQQPTNTPDQSGSNGNGSSFGSGSGSSFGSGSGFGSSNGFGNGQQGNNSGQPGQTFGGGGIIGVAPSSTKASILIYKKKKKYNEWEFVYDPALEKYLASLAVMGGAANGGNGLNNGQNGNGLNNNSGIGGSGFGGNNNGSGFGGSNNGSGFGGGNGSGSGFGGSGGSGGSGFGGNSSGGFGGGNNNGSFGSP